MANVIKVFTNHSASDIIKLGGSGYWKLNANRAAKCAYVVAVRNPVGKYTEDSAEPREAFLIGEISGIEPHKDGRYVIQFSRYALIGVSDAWDGSRNPVAYTTLKDLGINPADVKWINGQTKRAAAKALTAAPLTVDEAKRGLAAALGIKPEQVEISIRA